MALRKSLGRGCEVGDVPKPVVANNQILVKINTIALNPTNVKHSDVIAPPVSIIGCDFAGEVVEVGTRAPGEWEPGDRVAGTVYGSLYPDRGGIC